MILWNSSDIVNEVDKIAIFIYAFLIFHNYNQSTKRRKNKIMMYWERLGVIEIFSILCCIYIYYTVYTLSIVLFQTLCIVYTADLFLYLIFLPDSTEETTRTFIKLHFIFNFIFSARHLPGNVLISIFCSVCPVSSTNISYGIDI